MLRRNALYAVHDGDVVLVLGCCCHLGLVSLLGLVLLGCCLVSRRLSRRLGCRAWDGTRTGTNASARCRRPCSRGRG